MVEQNARVIAVIGDEVLLEAETRSSCQSCEVKSGCGTSVLSRWLGRKFSRFNASNTVNASVGDEVVVGLAESALLSGSMLVYLLPLLVMMATAIGAELSLQSGLEYRDLWVTLAGFAGLALGLRFTRQRLHAQAVKHRLTPVILRKVIGHGKLAS